ncbi:unnamed protein product, partial [Candidula unifasciata]
MLWLYSEAAISASEFIKLFIVFFFSRVPKSPVPCLRTLHRHPITIHNSFLDTDLSTLITHI